MLPRRPATGIDVSEFAENGEPLLDYAVKTDVRISNEAAVHRLPSSTLPPPAATAKNRPVSPILGFVTNGDFVVLAALLNKALT
jgi:hypothetical protein